MTALFVFLLFFNPTAMEDDYLNITKFLTVEEFIAIKEFIFEYGDKKTYCNKYNDNPYLKMDGFDIYMNPKDNYTNLADLDISVFNEIVIYNPQMEIQYFHIELGIRKAKQLSQNSTQNQDEPQVYLVSIYEENLEVMLKQLNSFYLPAIKEKVIK